MWFLLAVLFFILWIRARSNSKPIDDGEYARGYWNGYRAFGDKAAELLQSDTVSKVKLQQLISRGNGDESAIDESVVDDAKVVNTEVLDIVDDTLDVSSIYVQEATTAQPILTEEELTEAREAQTVRNLNILLYVGSFLIVAAAAVFVTLVMPAVVKLASLILVTGAFYVSGLVLFDKSERLRSAAVAFVGTGLAILPFVGFALTSLGGLSGEAAWFVTSLVGLVAYGLAAVRLQSQLVSYLTMAFVLSLALSAVSTLGLGMVWYFIVVIGVSLLCNSLHILWPNKVPDIFARPIEQTGQVTTPIALVASLLVADNMELFMYQVLYGVATAHYLVVWLEKRELLYEVVVRVLSHITLLLVAADITKYARGDTGSPVLFGACVLVLATAQVAYSLARVQKEGTVSGRVERWFVACMLAMMTVGMSYWVSAYHASYWVVSSLTVIGLSALGATLRFRQTAWAYVGLMASVILPYVLMRHVMNPPVMYEVMSGGFTVLALFVLMGLDRARQLGKSLSAQNMLSLSAAVYAICIIFSGNASGSSVTTGWSVLLAGGVFVLLSYLLRSAVVELVGAVCGVMSVSAWVDSGSVQVAWQLPVTIVVSVALAAAAMFAHHFRKESVRRDYLVAFGAVVLAGLVFTIGSEAAVVRCATALLVLAGVGAMALRLVLGVRKSLLVQITQIAYVTFPIIALFVAFSAGLGWVGLVLAVATAQLWVSSYIEKAPAVLVVGNVALVAALTSLWQWLDFAPDWQLYGVTWLSATVFYAMYWYMRDKADEWRQWASLGSMWVMLAVASWVNLWIGETTWVFASAGSLLAIGVTLGIHGYLMRERNYIEVAIYIATFSVQRMVALLIPEATMVVYGHWWAVTIGLVAWWRADAARLRSIIALACVTGSTGFYALIGEPGYSLVFLVEHILLLVAGAMLRKQWVMWWGIISVVVAVLYFLRGYTFLVLLFLGFLLILFVIWRLTKMGKK